MSKAFVIKNKEGKYFESQCIATKWRWLIMANLIELYDKWKSEQTQETLEEHYKKLKELEENDGISS